jgi:hypothetical protein
MATTTPDDTARAYRAGYRASARVGHPNLDVAEDRYRARYGDALAQHYGQGWVDYSADLPATPPVHGVYASEAMPAESAQPVRPTMSADRTRRTLDALAAHVERAKEWHGGPAAYPAAVIIPLPDLLPGDVVHGTRAPLTVFAVDAPGKRVQFDDGMGYTYLGDCALDVVIPSALVVHFLDTMAALTAGEASA